MKTVREPVILRLSPTEAVTEVTVAPPTSSRDHFREALLHLQALEARPVLVVPAVADSPGTRAGRWSTVGIVAMQR